MGGHAIPYKGKVKRTLLGYRGRKNSKVKKKNEPVRVGGLGIEIGLGFVFPKLIRGKKTKGKKKTDKHHL